MMHAMGRFYILFFGLEILLVALALISCLSAEDGEVRALPRHIWIIIILLFPIVGSIAYFAAGRPVTTAPRSTWRAGGGFPEATRPPRTAPDDDPAFLARLDERSRRQDEEMMRKWEEDLRRREDELRKKQDSTGGDA
jgi:Phospholipase_D-nuclease N-terminal